MWYGTKNQLIRCTSPLSILAFLPALMALQQAPARGSLQDSGVRVGIARSQVANRMPVRIRHIRPCEPIVGEITAPLEGIDPTFVRTHLWPEPRLPVVAGLVASGTVSTGGDVPAVAAPALAAIDLGERIDPPTLKPEPWPSPPRVGPRWERRVLAHVEPSPPELTGVTAPREALGEVVLAFVPWPAPSDGPDRCPVA
jgi:hypothetical protein